MGTNLDAAIYIEVLRMTENDSHILYNKNCITYSQIINAPTMYCLLPIYTYAFLIFLIIIILLYIIIIISGIYLLKCYS